MGGSQSGVTHQSCPGLRQGGQVFMSPPGTVSRDRIHPGRGRNLGLSSFLQPRAISRKGYSSEPALANNPSSWEMSTYAMHHSIHYNVHLPQEMRQNSLHGHTNEYMITRGVRCSKDWAPVRVSVFIRRVREGFFREENLS